MGKRKGMVKREGDEGGRGRREREMKGEEEGEDEESGRRRGERRERPDGAEGKEDGSFE